MTATAAVLHKVSKRFGDTLAVNDLSISVQEGSIYGLIGPNGAGKTTALRMLMGIFQADSGHVEVLGGKSPGDVKSHLGYLPEEKGLYRKMRVLDLVVFFGTLKGLSRNQAIKAADQLLEEFGLEDRRHEKCETLSKGMGQKLQIVCTLVHQPKLIVLDEPFSGLDPINVELIRRTILNLKKSGTTLVLSTHIMEQAEQICDEISLVNKGKTILQGNLHSIRQQAENRISIDYTGVKPFPAQLPGVNMINDYGNTAELRLSAGTRPQTVLELLLSEIEITRFDTNQTSLHEIFIAHVGSDLN